jgi:hypothetical protein
MQPGMRQIIRNPTLVPIPDLEIFREERKSTESSIILSKKISAIYGLWFGSLFCN